MVLDLGCGAGRDTLALAGSNLDVIGADLAWSGLQIARGRKKPKGIHGWVKSDARCLPFLDSSMDGVYCFGLLHEFIGRGAARSVDGIMAEVRRVLKTGGLLALAVLSGDPKSGLPHVRLFSKNMVEKAIRDLEVIEKKHCIDVGCTGCRDYKVWVVICRKGEDI